MKGFEKRFEFRYTLYYLEYGYDKLKWYVLKSAMDFNIIDDISQKKFVRKVIKYWLLLL